MRTSVFLLCVLLGLIFVYVSAVAPPVVPSADDYLTTVLSAKNPSSIEGSAIPFDEVDKQFRESASQQIVDSRKAELASLNQKELDELDKNLSGDDAIHEEVTYKSQESDVLRAKETKLQELSDLVTALVNQRKQATTKATELETAYTNAKKTFDNIHNQLKAAQQVSTKEVTASLGKQLGTAKINVVKAKIALKSARKEARKLYKKIVSVTEELADAHKSVHEFSQRKIEALKKRIAQITAEIQSGPEKYVKYMKQEQTELQQKLSEEMQHLAKLETTGKLVESASKYVTTARSETKQRIAKLFAGLAEKIKQAKTKKELKTLLETQFRLKVKLARRKLERVIDKAQKKVRALRQQIQHAVLSEDRNAVSALLAKIKSIKSIIAKLRKKLKSLSKRHCIKVDSVLLCNVKRTYYQGQRAFVAKKNFRKCFYVKRPAKVLDNQRSKNFITYTVEANAWVKICQSYPPVIIKAVKRIAYTRLVASDVVLKRVKDSSLLVATSTADSLAKLTLLLRDAQVKHVFNKIVREVKTNSSIQKLLLASKPIVSITEIKPEVKSQVLSLSDLALIKIGNATTTADVDAVIAGEIQKDIEVKNAAVLSKTVVKTVSVMGCNGKVKKFKIKIRRPFCKHIPKQVQLLDADEPAASALAAPEEEEAAPSPAPQTDVSTTTTTTTTTTVVEAEPTAAATTTVVTTTTAESSESVATPTPAPAPSPAETTSAAKEEEKKTEPETTATATLAEQTPAATTTTTTTTLVPEGTGSLGSEEDVEVKVAATASPSPSKDAEKEKEAESGAAALATTATTTEPSAADQGSVSLDSGLPVTASSSEQSVANDAGSISVANSNNNNNNNSDDPEQGMLPIDQDIPAAASNATVTATVTLSSDSEVAAALANADDQGTAPLAA